MSLAIDLRYAKDGKKALTNGGKQRMPGASSVVRNVQTLKSQAVEQPLESDHMHDHDFLVPSALVDSSLAAELLRDQTLPLLSRVLARAGKAEDIVLAEHAPLTPWQSWVFGVQAGLDANSAINLAELWAMACGIAPASNRGRWLAEPAHFVIARDHLRLDDPLGLGITIAEARALADAIEPVLSEAGWRLEPIEPATLTHWLLYRDDGLDLSGAAIERAIGDNVAAWQPRTHGGSNDAYAGSDAALDWRRCSNEIQMLWFGHPVNDAREERGLPSINTLWLSGNGAPPSPLPHYRAVDSSLPLLASLPVEPDATRALESFDGFMAAERADDWSGWRTQLEALDARIGALLEDQRKGAIGDLTIQLCGRDRIRSMHIAPRDLGKFWRGWGAAPSLIDFFTDDVGPDASA